MMAFYIHLVASICTLLLPSIHPQHLDSTMTIHDRHLHPQQNANQRNLQASPPFSTLNNILSEITLVLPEADVSSNGLDVTITDLICYDVNIQDVQVSRSSINSDIDRVAINASGLTITCNFRWQYQWSILSIINGSGGGKAILDPSSGASITLDIVSGRPPRDVSVDSCNAYVQIYDLTLDGDGLGAIASVINLFEKLVIGVIEEEVNSAICSQINELGNEDGALVFVIESNEKVVNYQTGDLDASSSGVGWLILFLVLILVYSISCCVFGAFCIGKIRSFNSWKTVSFKSMHNDRSVEKSKTDENIETRAESAEADIENQNDVDEAKEPSKSIDD